MLMVALCVGFTSCGSDDEEGDGGNGDGTKPNTRQVSKMIYDAADDEDWVETFKYDAQGRVSQYTISGSDYGSETICSYVYNKETIVANVTGGEDGPYSITYNLKDGLIVSQQSMAFHNFDVEFTHDSNNKLTKAKYTYQSGRSDFDTFEWTDGNLTSIYDKGTGAYTKYRNNETVDLNSFIAQSDLEEARGLEKYLGMLSTNLLDQGGRYEFDKNGSMTKLILSAGTLTVEYYK